MPYISPTFDQIRADILRDIVNMLPAADIGEDSDYFVRASSVASVATGIYQHQAWIVRQIFPDTADTEYLEWHSRIRNIFRKSLTIATGPISVTGEPGATADVGLVINRDSLSYTTTESVTIGTDSKATVQAIATQNGAAGNTLVAATGIFSATPTGFDSTVSVGIMAGGTDQETDAGLLARLLDVIRQPPAGGNKYDYRRWAMSVNGVTAAYVYPLRRGLGTVDVVITSANGLPSAEIIAATQTYIDEVRPVTAKNTLVLAPTFKIVDLTIKVSLEGVTLPAVTAAIEQALADYADRIAPGEGFIRSQAEMIISEVTGVIDRVVISPTGNVLPAVNEDVVEWIRLGTVSVTLL